MRTSEQINDLATALAAFQGEVPPVEKNKEGKVKGESKNGKAYEYAYKYADIADILSTALPVLSKHGLSIVQATAIDGRDMNVVSRLLHQSGQWIESDYPVCSIGGDHQKMGGALTYARRYAACSLLGIAPEEDVDGEAAATEPTRTPAPRQQSRPAPQPAPDDDVDPEKEARALAYIAGFRTRMQNCSTADEVTKLWAAEAAGRADAGLSPIEVGNLMAETRAFRETFNSNQKAAA